MRTGEGKRVAVAPGEQHGEALIVADPAVVAVSEVGEMRREQAVEAVVLESAFERRELDFLENDVAVGIGEDVLLDAIATVQRGVHQPVSGNAFRQLTDARSGMTLLFGKVVGPVGDEQTLISGAGLIDAREVDLIKNAVAGGEPNLAVQVERGAHAGLGA